MHFKIINSEIAQLELSDLGRELHARRIPSALDIHSPSVAAGEDALKVIRSAERVGAHSTVGKQNITSTWFTELVLVLFSNIGSATSSGLALFALQQPFCQGTNCYCKSIPCYCLVI
jgi:hypothetical protein